MGSQGLGSQSKVERVQRLEAYRFSSYPGYVAKKDAEDFVCYDVLKQHGATLHGARRFYRAYTHACVMEDGAPLMDAMWGSRCAIGGEAFVEETEKRLERQRTSSPPDEDLALPAVTVDIQTVDRYVARHYRIEPEGLKAHGERAGVAKYVAVELACRLTGHSGRAVGEHYSGISSAAVSTIRRRLREGNYDLTSAVNHSATAIVKAGPSKTQHLKPAPELPVTLIFPSPSLSDALPSPTIRPNRSSLPRRSTSSKRLLSPEKDLTPFRTMDYGQKQADIQAKLGLGSKHDRHYPLVLWLLDS